MTQVKTIRKRVDSLSTRFLEHFEIVFQDDFLIVLNKVGNASSNTFPCYSVEGITKGLWYWSFSIERSPSDGECYLAIRIPASNFSDLVVESSRDKI